MPLLAILVTVLSLGICLIPIFLLRRRHYEQADDYYVSSQPTPPEVIRNSSIAHGVRLSTFGPFFALGASGDVWPIIVGAVCLGFGFYLIFVLHRPILAFLADALSGDRSFTVHEFIARQHGSDPRVRLLACALSIVALLALMTVEALALAALLKLLLGHGALVPALMLGVLLLAVLYAIPAGHSGIMQATQLQLGMIHLGLFGAIAFLLYLHVSALTLRAPHGTLAMAFAALCCGFLLFYRRVKYVDTTRLAGDASASAARLLSRFEKILNPVIAMFAVLVVVIAGMEFSVSGFFAWARDSAAALQAAPRLPIIALIALALLPLLQPIIDVTNWQRLAAAEKDFRTSRADSERRSGILLRVYRGCAVETGLLWLLLGMFGALAALATQAPADADVMDALLQQMASGENPVTSAALVLLLVAVFAIALSTMSSAFAAALCAIRYDLLAAFPPEPSTDRRQSARRARRPILMAGSAFFLIFALAFYVLDAVVPISFTSSTFLAFVFALASPPLACVPLLVGPMLVGSLGRPGNVTPAWALLILAAGVASGLGAVILYLASGIELWLWAAGPACVGVSFLLFTVACRGSARIA